MGTAKVAAAIREMQAAQAMAVTARVPGVPTAVTVWREELAVTLDATGLSGLQKMRARSVFTTLGAHPYHVDQMTNAGRFEHPLHDVDKAASAVATIFEKVLGKPLGGDVTVEPVP